tara:strand:+ start:2357 stop:2728 length:372 start_codon:yes stop_codon:yes gene_type:complete
MIKPLIPISIFVIWSVIFEEKIWVTWEDEKPTQIFDRGELLWEFQMDDNLAKKKHQFKFIQTSGEITKFNKDTVYVDNIIRCIKDTSDKYPINLNQIVSVKGRLLNYNSANGMLKLDHCFFSY